MTGLDHTVAAADCTEVGVENKRAAANHTMAAADHMVAAADHMGMFARVSHRRSALCQIAAVADRLCTEAEQEGTVPTA